MRLKRNPLQQAMMQPVLFLLGLLLLQPLLSRSVYAWDWPQCRNYNGGGPEQPSSIYLGDTGTFGCDSWDMVNTKWGKHQVWIDQDQYIDSGSSGSWSSHDNTDHNQETSPTFTATGTWYWGMKVEYTDAGGTTGWYCRDDTSWNNMYGTPDSDLTVTVAALTNPASILIDTNATNPDTKIDLSWEKWSNRSVMIVRRKGFAVAWSPTQGTAYSDSQDLGSDTIVVSGSLGDTNITDTGLLASTTYHYKLYSENNSYYSDGAVTNETTAAAAVADPALTVGPGALVFAADLGATPSAKTFTATNTGGGTLLYTNAITYGASPGWLTLAPTNGSLAADATQIHTATVSQATSVGVYYATNTLTGNQTNSAKTVTVTYTVSALSNPSGQTAVTNTSNPSTQVDLGWTKANGYSVMIVRREGQAVAWTPSQGTAYTNTQDLGNDTIVVRGSEGGTSITDTGLTPETAYDYKFYSENYSYYSAGVTANETTGTDPGNCWHVPANAEPSGTTMRAPITPGSGDTVYIYNGNQFQGGGNPGNQSSGTLYYKKDDAGSWSSTALGYDSESGNNKYWKGTIAGGSYASGDTIEYYIAVSYSDHDTTYIGTTNSGAASLTYVTESKVQTNAFTFSYSADLGNCWHIPTNSEPPSVTMRSPTTAPATNQFVYLYSGNQFQGAGNPGNQTGGTLCHRLEGGSWSSTNLAYDSQNGNNKYWAGTIPANTYSRTNVVEYYLKLTYSDQDTSYIGTTNSGVGSVIFSTEGGAQANPFAVTYADQTESSAAYVQHNDNRVSVGDDVQCWAKLGYAEGTGSNRWVEYAAIYYTTNGVTPSGGYGAASNASTKVTTMSFDHMESDPYPNADAMWWVGTLTNLPDQTTIKYKIGAWKSASGIERFGDYNTSGTDNDTFSFAHGVDTNGPVLTVGSLNGDYTTTKLFVDEIAGDSESLVVTFEPNEADITNVEVFSNLGRRDYVDVDYTNAYLSADGYPDGINPPDGNLISTGDTGAYFTAFTMASQGDGSYAWTGTVSRCGAYRLTARWQTTGMTGTNWNWYTGTGGRRDHAVVVSPTKVHDLTLYELNTLTVEATDNTESGRSTFEDLLGSADGDSDGYDHFNLDYLNFIQANCLWFQPIHPNAEERGDDYTPGSPYSTRDYFAVTPYMGSANTAADAMNEFTNFVIECDGYTGSVGTVNVMLDGVFNHSSWDAEMGQGGVDLGFAGSATDRIGAKRPSWYSLITDYGLPATSYTTSTNNDFATAPDRGDFGKWEDTAELFFGDYSALVRHNPDNNGDYLDEGDVYEFSGMSTNTMDLWRYFAYYPEYWLEKTGHAGTNTFVQAQDDKGIDGLRCDFGQGLPPQAWEYIINRTRSKKWNFIFMAETLDGGVPGYRSNRHFDILNESIVFQFTQSHINDSWDVQSALEDRRSVYNSGAILLNLTSHDEILPDNDAWLTASRYGALSSVDGLPMMFYGQEKGIQNYNSDPSYWYYDGFKTDHEENFGKYVPHFKQWNRLTVWTNPPPSATGLDQWYGRVNWARLNSPALRSRNRYFLNKVGGGDEGKIFAVAKYETANGSPASNDVVLAFSLLLRHGEAHAAASATYNLQPVWSLLGMNTNNNYNVRNLASSDAATELWSTNMPGADLYNDGIYVNLVADTGTNTITQNGALVQYLKIVEYIPDDPALSVGPTSMTFTAALGATPEAQTFTVTNLGERTLIYTNTASYGAGPGWLSFAPSTGSVGEDGTLLNTATVSQATSVGTFYATNTLTGNQTNGTKTISVTYTVSALSDPSNFLAVTNTATPNSQIDLSWTKANGYSVMIVRRKGAAVAWSPSQGTAYTNTQDLGSDTIVVRGSEGATSITNTGLEASTTYHYKIYTENYSYYSSGVITNETTSATPPASMSLGPPTLAFSTSLGGTPVAQTFIVTNTGVGTLLYTNATSYGTGPGWLTLAPTNASLAADATQIHTATVSQATSVGVFAATNTLSGNQDNGAKTVSSTYTVNALSNPTALSASAIGTTNLTVNWTKGAFDVMVVRRAGADPDAPTGGTAYVHNETYGTDNRNQVIYAHGADAADIDVGLTRDTVYHYGFYSENYSYYSSGAFLVATTEVAAVDGEVDEWVGTAPAVVNSSTVENNEFIWTDKQYERRTESGQASDVDMLEFRMLADADDVYFMVKFDDITDIAYPYVAIGLDIDRDPADTNMTWMADESDTVISDGYYTNGNAAMHYPERNIIVHTVPNVGQRIELHANNGGDWYAPPTHGNDPVWFNANSGKEFIEFKISRTDLGISGSVTARFTVASYFNNTSIGDDQYANDGDTTADYGTTDAQDSLSLLTYNYNDGAGTASAWDEELSDGDMDSFFDVTFDAAGVAANTLPTTPSATFPAEDATIEQGPMSIMWSTSTDSDDSVTSYLAELCTNASFKGGENLSILHRGNTRHNEPMYGISTTLATNTYYWRTRARDLDGALSGHVTNTFVVGADSDDDTTGPTATLLYVGSSYTEGASQTNITDVDFENTSDHVDIAIVWSDPSGVFMTNGAGFASTNISSNVGRVVPNWDLYKTNSVSTDTMEFGFDQVFTTFYGTNGATSVTSVYLDAFAVTDAIIGDQFFLSISAEDNDNDRGAYADPGSNGDPVPWDREVTTNTLVRFYVIDDDSAAPVFSAVNVDGSDLFSTRMTGDLSITGLLQDAGSGVYGGASNRYVLYRNDSQVAAGPLSPAPGSDGAAMASAEAIGTTISNTTVVIPGRYRFDAFATDYDLESDDDSITVTSSFDFVVGTPAFDYRARIDAVDYTGSPTLTNFPVQVVLSTSIGGFSYSQFESPTGGDLRFCDEHGDAWLDYAFRNWDTGGSSTNWVKIPELTTNTVIWAYWGNGTGTNAAPATTNGAVWSDWSEAAAIASNFVFGTVADVVAPGTYFELDGAAGESGVTLPFLENFESVAVGSLDGANDWHATGTTRALNQTTTVQGGSRGAALEHATVWHGVEDATGTDVWVSWYAWPTPCATNPVDASTLSTNTTAVFYLNTNGNVVALSNSTWVTFSDVDLGTNDWIRFVTRMDYAADDWDLYAVAATTNARIAESLPFKAANRTAFTSFRSVEGGLMPLAYLDNFGVATNKPLGVDTDSDDLPDMWEETYMTNISQTAAGDLDNDGITNLREYLAGTDPTDSNDTMRIVGLDLAGGASSHIDLSLLGGGAIGNTNFFPVGEEVDRRFRIYAADNNATNPMVLVATVEGDSSGTNTWRDSGMTDSYSSRYYEISVEHTSGGYTNTEAWAVHVQPRSVSNSYMICVPIRYEGTNNNLNAMMGTHLARGLHDDAVEADADWIEWMDADGNWEDYWLSEDGWKVKPGGTDADVSLTAGQAIRVHRRGEAAPRDNTVFAGKSFTESDVASFGFSIGDDGLSQDGWTMFGWPLPQQRQASASDTSQNQLGFYTDGAGGVPGTTTTTDDGDELWIWNGSNYDRYMLLDDQGAHDYNGRWWDLKLNAPADITLAPGGAYYYYHTTNWSASNFNWTPDVP
ncbi:MAG: hypothetical protein HN341_14070 [Verrucomicrobia bacterium]|jgi:hypothetical protein|nr:hypothetical protein [Verrucomicrobiota bacterium]